MKNKLKRYKISQESETYAISLVDYPAIEVDWVYLSNQKPLIFKSDEKHLIIGPALIPSKPIYRRYEDEEFEVVFESDVIEKMSYEFMKKERTNCITLDHLDFASNISVVESWIKTTENDKSNDYGFDCPVGTWFIAMKVNDDETWNRIKSGELRGFSIESLVSLDEYDFSKIENNKDNNTESEMINVEMDEQGFLDKIKAIISEALGKSNDEPKEEVVAETSEEIVEVAEDELETPVEETVEASEDVVPTEEPVVEQVVEEVVETVEENAVTEEEVKEDLQEVVNALNAQIEALNAQVEELKAENKKLGRQPSTKPVNMASEKVDSWEMLRQLRESRYGK